MPERLKCAEGEVHVWRLLPGASAALLDGLAGLLDEEELARAARFVRQVERDEYIATRGALRILLSRYLGTDAGAIRFGRAPNGKPVLEAGTRTDDIRFSVAHSGGAAVLAVASATETGVDLEQVRPGLATASIALRYFRPDEVERLAGLSREAYDEAFLRCWTRLEARLKLSGRGLVALGSVDADHDEACTVHDLDPAPGFVGALAVQGRVRRIVCRDIPTAWLAQSASVATPGIEHDAR